MEEIIISANNFVKSIENKDNINTIQNNLSLLIGQINILYYKYTFINSESCTKINNDITIDKLEEISEQIRNIYPKFVELRKEQFKKTFLDKLQCNNTPTILIDNITRTNKIQSMLSDLTDLLYFNSNEISDFDIDIEENNNKNLVNISNINTTLKSGSIILIFILVIVIFIIIVLLAIYLLKKFKPKTGNTLNTTVNTSEA
jgi:hypothetical protein